MVILIQANAFTYSTITYTHLEDVRICHAQCAFLTLFNFFYNLVL